MNDGTATLQPLSNELIGSVLDAREFTYFTDADGDIGGWWYDNLIYFSRLGPARELLQVRTRSHRDFDIDDVPRLHAFCNRWNHDKLWPKAYVHVADDGTAFVVGEVVTDLEYGVSAEQLDQLMMCGIATGCELATEVDAL
jgi:hypothetical protein